MAHSTLLRQGSPLSRVENQLKVLNGVAGRHQSFDDALREQALFPLRATDIEVLQINLGKLCNQTCRHCHVDAGPDRREIMSRETLAACLEVLARTQIPTVDITGGAPEMNPHFRWLVEESRRLGRHVIDRSNLTILLAPGFDDLPRFLAGNQVEVVASLPCYLEENTDRQRGAGVFAKSLEALRRLNALGYGGADGALALTLVYNPIGPTLPPPQDRLEEAFRRELHSRYGITFSRLFTITNMPISRFLDDLVQAGRYDDYMRTLIEAYNPLAAERVMCRTTLSVDWQGRLHDCDFNQMLDLGLADGQPRNIRDFDLESLSTRRIMTGRHCFGCTAGAGSTCQGAVLKSGM
ncbi:MAG TPA: arsenosugar biosynthesis radical SAM (seleno)protein ArsS [Pirellulales bacterium]|nr:arsenosugar biosynthesis radical SAM (seleno)protein ArsS [Pirellulales bacterium]